MTDQRSDETRKKLPSHSPSRVNGFRVVSHKACTGCRTFKPIELFYWINRDSCRNPLCPDCESLKQKARWQREKTSAVARRSHLQSKLKHFYGITLEEHCALLATGCVLCGTKKNLVVDHDHVTGKVRGALCVKHNNGLGLFNDNPVLLSLASQYVFRGIRELVFGPMFYVKDTVRL